VKKFYIVTFSENFDVLYGKWHHELELEQMKQL